MNKILRSNGAIEVEDWRDDILVAQGALVAGFDSYTYFWWLEVGRRALTTLKGILV